MNIIRNQRGTIMLEFAGSMIILIILYLGLITMCLFLSDYTSIRKVARDGAREITITNSQDMAEQRVEQSAWLYKLDPDKLTVDFNQYELGERTLVSCEVKYLSSPFSKAFPSLVGEDPISEKELYAEAVFGWWDVVE
jgi:hypothetical protein